jgi:hypothetical protein
MDKIVLVYVILIPCGIVVASVLGFWLPFAFRSDASASKNSRMIFTAGLGAALAYMAGHWGIYARPTLPPTDAADWLFYIAPVAALLSLIEAIGNHRAVRSTLFHMTLTLFRAALISVGLWLILAPIRRSWTPSETWTWIPALTLVLLLIWESFTALARRIPSYDTAAAVFPVALGISAAISLSGGARFGLFAAVLVAVCGSIFVGSLLRRELPLARGLVAVVPPIGFLLLVLGKFLDDVPLSSAALLAGAPFMAWIPQWRAIQRLKPWQIALIRFMLIACVAGAAVGIANSHFEPESLGE